MKIVFFGTSEIGLPILEALHAEHEIIHIVTSPDSKVGRKQVITATPIAEFALANDILVSKPEKVKSNVEFVEFLKTMNADLFVVISYGKILPAELLNIPPLKTINIHFSLLPKYRGPAPIQFALMNGDTVTGTTIFVLDELVDHGPIIATEKLDIEPDDNFNTLAQKLSELSAKLVLEILPKYQSGEIVPQEQNHDDATKTHMISKEDGKVDWANCTAQDIYNKYRAFSQWPGIWTTYEGEVLKIINCSVVGSASETEKDIISCKDNTFLKLEQVQLAGKNKMTMKDFLNGHPNFSSSDLA